MTANEKRPKKLKGVVILPTSENNVSVHHRPFSCCWYRIVFKSPVPPDPLPADPPAE